MRLSGDKLAKEMMTMAMTCKAANEKIKLKWFYIVIVIIVTIIFNIIINIIIIIIIIIIAIIINYWRKHSIIWTNSSTPS